MIRLAQPRDAAQIAALLEECYRDSYRLKEYLDPAHVVRSMEAGRASWVVGEEAGCLVGMACMESTGPRVWEYGRGVVSCAHRSRGLLTAIGARLLHEEAPRVGARFVTASAVTNHPYAQRNTRSLGMAATGVLLGVAPADTEMDGFGRVRQPVSMVQHALKVSTDEAPRRLGLEGADLVRAQRVLAALEIESGRSPRRAPPLRWTFRHDEAFGIAHLRPALYGAVGRLTEQALGLRDTGRRLVWVDVPAEHPDVQQAADALRAWGFAFGAYLPAGGPLGEDVLRLQRVLDPAPFRREEVVVLEEHQLLLDEILCEAALGPLVPALAGARSAS